MSLFKEMLDSDESLFKNEIALGYDYIPKLLPYRESQQRYIANCIKPLLQLRNGKNLLVHGKPGIGKTSAIKWIFRDLEEQTEEVIPIYINCWQKNTSFKVFVEICDQLGYKFVQNKNTEELFKVIKQILNKKAAVFAFDEIDKVEDYDFLYSLLEEIYRKSILLLTNHKQWFVNIDQRLKSRLTADGVEFKPYTSNEIAGILRERISYAFVSDVFEKEALDLIVKKTCEVEDIRQGLFLLKESAQVAESHSSKSVSLDHANEAIEKIKNANTLTSRDLEDDLKMIFALIKENNGFKAKELHTIYSEKGGSLTYKSFYRRLGKLEQGKFISIRKIEGGAKGNTSVVSLIGDKKLTEF